MVRDPQHGHVVKGVEVILRDTPLPHRLNKRYLRPFEAEVADQSPEIGVGVIYLPQQLDDSPVIQAKTSGILHQLDFRQSGYEVVISLPDGEEQWRLPAFLFHAEDYLVAFLPSPDEIRDQSGRV